MAHTKRLLEHDQLDQLDEPKHKQKKIDIELADFKDTSSEKTQQSPLTKTTNKLCFGNLKDILDVLKQGYFPNSKWFPLGIYLGLLPPTLKEIEANHRGDVGRCLIECLTLWLNEADKCGGFTTSWDSLADAVEKTRENITAKIIKERRIKEAHQMYLHTLSKSLTHPMEAAKLLFDEKCISETALKEIERLIGSLDEKNTALLSSIHTEISSDPKKLKGLASVLAKFEETKFLSDRIISDNAKRFYSEYLSHEDQANTIFCCHHATLSQSLQYPFKVAQLLCGENVIPETTVTNMETCNQSVTVLLKAIDNALHTNYQNLRVFANVLQRFTDNILLGNAIMKDYEQLFDDKGVQKVEVTGTITEESTSGQSSDNSSATQNAIFVPRNMSPTFHLIRVKFGIAFNKIRSAIKESSLTPDDLKSFLNDCYSDLTPQLTHSSSNTIDGILDVVKDKCTLIDICILEAIAERFDISKAESYIQAYNNEIDKFCQTVTTRLCLNESFEISKSSPLKCETATFVLEWDPDENTLADIKNLLSVAFGKLNRHVKIIVLKEGHSIILTCTFPYNLLSPLIAKAQATLELVKKRGLICLSIGICVIYDNHRDEEIKAIMRDNAELRNQLKMLETISRKKTLEKESVVKQTEELRLIKEKEIESLNLLLSSKEASEQEILSQSEEKQKEIETLQEIITSLTLQLRESEKQNDELNQKLKAIILKTHEEVVTAKKTQAKPSEEETSGEETGMVTWNELNNRIDLNSPSVKQCEDVVSRLKEEKDNEWSVYLYQASTESAAVIISNLTSVKGLDMHHTALDTTCVNSLSEALTNSKTLKRLHLYCSPPTDGMKQIYDALSGNTSLEWFWLTGVPLTDEEITQLSDLLKTNKTLNSLRLIASNVTDNNVQYIFDVLAKNHTITYLNISHNPQITSESTNIIADLIKTTTLTQLYLDNTSLKDEDITPLCAALSTNDTIETLGLSKKHEEICKTFDGYQSIRYRIRFYH